MCVYVCMHVCMQYLVRLLCNLCAYVHVCVSSDLWVGNHVPQALQRADLRHEGGVVDGQVVEGGPELLGEHPWAPGLHQHFQHPRLVGAENTRLVSSSLQGI